MEIVAKSVLQEEVYGVPVADMPPAGSVPKDADRTDSVSAYGEVWHPWEWDKIYGDVVEDDGDDD